jgi:glycerol dehydrogenase
MISSTIFPRRYIQGYDAIKKLGSEILRLGKTGFIISSPTVFAKILPDIKKDVDATVKLVAERFGGECCDEEIGRLCRLARAAGPEVIIGMGGGKTLDTAKAVAAELKLPVIIIPTVASSDAPCSALAVIYTADGHFKRVVVFPFNPDVVLVDTRIIAESPVRFLVAGMGDALSTWFEAESCRKKYAPNTSGYLGSMTAYALAHLCYQTLLEYGALAKRACESHLVTPAVEHIVEANILLSGIGFESGGVATAHALFDGFTLIKEAHAYLHGELVAFGTLVSLFLTDKPKDIIDQVYSFCESVGLPTTLGEIGLAGVSDEDIMSMANSVCKPGDIIYHEPSPISAEGVFAAIKVADLEGTKRKTVKD